MNRARKENREKRKMAASRVFLHVSSFLATLTVFSPGVLANVNDEVGNLFYLNDVFLFSV